MTSIKVNLGEREYAVHIGKGLLGDADKFFNLKRKVFILTDSGVPCEYAKAVAKLCESSVIYTVNEGEGSKSISALENVLKAMMSFEMSRKDALVCVGGGVVGDLGGFAASVYMRGIEFYNVPTTLLAAVDSSVGGKTAVNLGNTKNIVGAFYQPRGVIIDTDTLKTLPKRHISAGIAEAIKMSLTSDKALFEFFEKNDFSEDSYEKIITEAVKIKKAVVEKDEKESGLRKILNFGHTLGHGIEADGGLSELYHGECVALGMLPVCSDAVRERLIPILKKASLPTEYKKNIDSALTYIVHDKKATCDGIDTVIVNEIGNAEIRKIGFSDFSMLVKKIFS